MKCMMENMCKMMGVNKFCFMSKVMCDDSNEKRTGGSVWSDFFANNREKSSEKSDEDNNKYTQEALYNDWQNQIIEKIKEYLESNDSVSAKEVAQHLKISEESATFFMKKIK